MSLFLDGNKASYFYLVSQRWSLPEGSTYFEYYNLPTQLRKCTAFQISSHYSKYFKRLKDSRLNSSIRDYHATLSCKVHATPHNKVI